MKINRDLANKLILESESFRTFVLDTIFDEKIEKQVKSICEKSASKISAIKDLREFSQGRLDSFQREYPEIVNNDGEPNKKYLGLAEAKKIVEKHL